MKNCKDCNEFMCGSSGTDNISECCGKNGPTTPVMQDFGTGAIREDKTGKGRCDLLPVCALIRLSKRFEEGNKDHPERNWENGIPMHSFLDSALRHLFRYLDGQTDEDHLCAAAWNVMCAMWTEEKRPEMQDIPTRLDHPADASNEPNTTPEDDKCEYWLGESNPRCLNTEKAINLCSCGGDRSKCDLYAHVRKMANE